MEKDRRTAGADEKTPSRSQYFSWINNTNEGSTEEQTRINLAYFAWLHRTYGMQLDIYAWDAGNLDGASGTYETAQSAKLRRQYPEGYAPLAAAAAENGIRLGIWCGPDGYGETPEEEAARQELLVSLCRDLHFALFKMDGVCGPLRPEKCAAFIRTLEDCRRYSPDLILLNHRLELGEAEPYATTFLWQGMETYVDVHAVNPMTAPHNRAFLFGRGNVPGLRRLTEDHGVCLSSCLDYFEDDLIYQAFNRHLILAPEIYGNPWLLRDEEQARLARIFNLHRRFNDILTEGMLLDEAVFGQNAVARGDSRTRLLTFGNPSWEPRTVSVPLDGQIGLAPCEEVAVIGHHPYETLYGRFGYGDRVNIVVPPFRAVLLEVCDATMAASMPAGCAYEVLHETDGVPDTIRIVQNANFDVTTRSPRNCGRTVPCDIPAEAEALLEATLFAADNDSHETRCLRRAGKTRIPEVQAARDAFFGQQTYRARGCDAAFAFDGREDTFFDGLSKTAFGGLRVKGGCLRVDFGRTLDADAVVLDYFDTDEPTAEIRPQVVPECVEISADRRCWRESGSADIAVLREQETLPVVKTRVDTLYTVQGRRCRVTYPLDGAIRYLRMAEPLDRIYRIALMKDGQMLETPAARASNLLPHAGCLPVIGCQKTSLRIPPEEWREGCYLAVALEGVHGVEGAFATLSVEGPAESTLVGAPSRAPSYPVNPWEGQTRRVDRFYTYYIPVTQEMTGRELTVWLLLCDPEHMDFHADIYLCDTPDRGEGLMQDWPLR